MNIKPKNILPKSQMIINQLLSQLQNTPTNFRQEEFSIQVKNNSLLIVNFFEPDLQDIQWSIEFMGISSLNHVSVSHDKRKKIRLVFQSLNSLHFFQGDLKLRKNRIDFRNHFLNSQKIIPLKLTNTDDEILFISQDLFPDLNVGIFLISTVQRHFYVLKANINQQDLIDLNPQNKISRIFSSITEFLVSRKQQKQQKNLRKISHLLVRFPSHRQSFKAIIMEGFQIEIRFVNIPAIPGDKCPRDISQTKLINLEKKFLAEMKGEQELSFRLISSSLVRLGESQVAVLFLLSNNEKNNTFYLVSTVLDITKDGEITSTHHFEIRQDETKSIKDIEFEKTPDSDQLILKIQTKQSVLLNKMCIKTLKIIESVNYPIEGNTILSKSSKNQKILFLTPYSVYDINLKNQEQMVVEDKDQISMDEEDHKLERNNLLWSFKNKFDSNQQKLKVHFQNNNFTEISQILALTSQQLDSQLSIQKPRTISDKQVTQLLEVATVLNFYQAFNSLEEASNSKVSSKQRAFQNISKRDFKQILQVQQNLIESQKWSQFLEVWINFLDLYKSKQYFQNQTVRQIESAILNQKQFPSIFHQFFLSFEENVSGIEENKKDKIYKLIFTLIRSCSGIIKIERQDYRNLLKKPSNLTALKQVALEVFNFDLLAILYFELGEISQKQLQTCLKRIKPEPLFKKFAQNFISQYISRMKSQDYINPKAKNLNNILSVFRNHQDLIERLFEQDKSDLSILIGLRLGERQKLKSSIVSKSKRMRNDQNKKKILLTTFDQRDSGRMDEQ